MRIHLKSLSSLNFNNYSRTIIILQKSYFSIIDSSLALLPLVGQGRKRNFNLIDLYSGGNQHLHQCKTHNISFKCCSKHKSRDSFGFCSSWGFQNTPNMLKLIEFWLRYLRSKTNDRILKISSKLIKIDENLMKSTHFVSKVINSTSKTSHWLLKNNSHWHWCPQK